MSEVPQQPLAPPAPSTQPDPSVPPAVSYGAAGGQAPYDPVAGEQLPGMTPGAFDAASNPMQVPNEVALNPWTDPNAVQHMMLANQGLKEFDGFVARNNVARLVPGKRVKSFLRVPNGVVQSQGVMTPGLTLDRTVGEAVHPSDIYVPVMDGEDDKSAYERYQKDLEKWNGSLLPFRWADLIASRLVPSAAEGTVGNYFAGMLGQVGLPLALDDLRKHVAKNAPVYGLERFDTEKGWLSPDWTWAVFGGAMKGGAQLATAGMLRFVETGLGQAFMRGLQKAGIGALADAGMPVFGEPLLGSPMGRSSALFEWIGNKVGSKAFANVRPETFRRAEAALREAEAQIRITPEGIDVGLAGAAGANTGELKAALRALKVEMSNAGEKVAFRLFTDVPETFGQVVGGAAAGGAIAADPLARIDLSPEQRKLIAQGIPAAMVIGGGIPLGFRATQGAIDLLSRNQPGAPRFRTPDPGETTVNAQHFQGVTPSGEQPKPPPPKTFGDGPTSGGAPPGRPGPTGPSTPDSGIYSMPLAHIPSFETNGALATPAAEQFGIQASVRVLQRTLPAIQDPKQLFQARKLLDGLAAEQTQMRAALDDSGADPSMLESRNRAVASRLDAANRLLGKDLTSTTFALGLPTESILFDPMIPPELNSIEPLRMGLLTWAHGLAAEAMRVGVDLPTATAALPPPGGPWDLQTITARLQTLAQQVKLADPDAAVGPPIAMTPDLPEEIRRGRPVRVEPIPPVDLPDPHTITAQHFPTASELRSEPSAVRRQTYVASKLASGMRFHVGDLIPSNPQGLSDMDPIRVPVFQDPAGRLMARTPAHDAADNETEITDSISRIGLPAEARWEFAPNPLAPIPYKLDPEQELLAVDQDRFEARQWARDAYRDAVWENVQGEMEGSPTANPIAFASALRQTPPQSIEDANGALDQINKMQAEHEGRRPTLEMAAAWAGPGAGPEDIFTLHHEMVKEYSGMGALIELARATALSARAGFEATAAAVADPQPFGWGASSPFGIEAAHKEERHQRGPAIYGRISQILNALPADAKWTPETIARRIQADGVALQDYEIADIQTSLLAKSGERGWLTTREAGEVVDARGEMALAETLNELLGPGGPFQTIAQMAKSESGDRAQTRFDPKLIGALGASQYGGQLGPIIVKELLQNAKDGMMAAIERGWNKSDRPTITLEILTAYVDETGLKNAISIRDNGIGMPPEVAATEYVEIGGSFKPQITASGGFGLAKIAYFPNALLIDVTTIADTDSGRMKTELKGSGEDWADTERGLAMRVIPADATEDTGTSILLQMNDKVSFTSYGVDAFLDSFARYSDLPFDFKYTKDNKVIAVASRPRSKVLVVDAPGAEVQISTFDESPISEGSCSLHIGNNGIYQFTEALYGPGIFPAELWVDVKAKVPVDDPSNSYPFTTNREQLKDSLKRELQSRISSEISSVMHKKQQDLYRKIVEDSPKFVHSPKHHIVDTQQNIPEGVIARLAENKELADLFELLSRHFSSYLALVNRLEVTTTNYTKEKARFFGLGISAKYYGVNIGGHGLGRDRNHILINPFVAYLTTKRWVLNNSTSSPETPGRMVSQMLATSIHATIIHEITHQASWGHSEEFSSALTRNLGVLAHMNSRFSTKLQELLEKDNGALLHTITEFSSELESYWLSGKDILESISAHSRRLPGPGGDQSGPPDRGGRRSGERGSVRGSPQDETPSVGSGSPLRGSGTPEEEAEARLRAEALTRIVSGDGWSGKRGPKLFASLTDSERTDALASRIATGKFVNRKHLMAMSPQKWEATGKFPKYFAEWRPTPGQMTVLKDTFNERLAIFNKSAATLEKIVAASKPRIPGGMRPPLLSLKDIAGIDPTHLEELSKDHNAFDEWVRQFYRSVDPIANDPEVQGQRDVRESIELLKDAVRTMGDTRVLGGVHPYDEPPTAFGTLSKLTAWAHNQQAIMQGRIRMLGRPSYVIGWRKQITHPAEWNENKEELGRNVYHILYSAYLRHAQDLEGHINRTATLAQAASKWMSAKAPAHPALEDDGKLDTSKPPPKSMTPSVILDRAIATFLDQRPSALEIAKSAYRYHEIKIGLLGNTKIDLAVEMPKLYRLYDELIGKAEQSMILKHRTESVKKKAKGEALEGELRARILRAAQAEMPEGDYQSFEQIDPDVVKATVKSLRVTDKGNRGADPMSIGARGFTSVEAGWRSALREYAKHKDMIAGIQNGDLRREGYYTAVHKMTVDEVRNMLRDPQSVWSRYTTSDVRNYFLNERKSDKEPYRSWAVGWSFYLPAMLRTIHLEPALINVIPKIQQLPADMREYADQIVRQMKGDLDPTDRLFNQLAMMSWAENPTLASELSRWAGADHVTRLREDPEARLQLVGSKAWTRFVEGIAGGTYLALMSPLKVAKMTVTELAFWAREYMKRPQDSIHLAAFGAAGLGRAGFEGVRELASWLHSLGYGGPRWYGEATMMKVTDSLNEMALERHTLPTHLDVPAKLFKTAVQTWYGVMRSTEYSLRASTYYSLKANALRFGLEEEDARELAARMTNDLIGAFGPLETSPSPRGTTGRAVFQFKRFLAAKTDLLMGDFSNSTRLFMPTRDLNLSLGHGGGAPPPDTPLGLAVVSATPPGGGPPPPPPLTNSSFGEWGPDERNAWDKYAEPVAHMGTSFASSRVAQGRSFLAFLGLLAAAYPTIGFVSQFARLFWQNDDPNAPGQSILDMMFPWDFRRINTIPMLWPVEYVERIALLEAKKYAPFTGGLTSKEERELNVRKQTMVEAAWPMGAVLKQRRYDEQQQKYDENKAKRDMREQSRRPKGPSRPGIGGQ